LLLLLLLLLLPPPPPPPSSYITMWRDTYELQSRCRSICSVDWTSLFGMTCLVQAQSKCWSAEAVAIDRERNERMSGRVTVIITSDVYNNIIMPVHRMTYIIIYIYTVYYTKQHTFRNS